MNLFKSLLLGSTLLAGTAFAANADVKVAASIKPVHSLVAAVMEGIGEPDLIVDGAGSPHTYALKPSQARMLEKANVVFWIGHELEAFLEKPVETLAANAKSVELINSHDLIKLEFREGGAFETHDHVDEPGHDDHDSGKEAEAGHDHDHEEKEANHDHEHKAEEAAKTGHDDGGHDGHLHGTFDAHVWLDPINAKAMVHEIEEALVDADPENASKYKTNAQAVMAKLDELTTEVTSALEPVRDERFVVFHDAYQYFEKRFGLSASGSVTISPEVMPGAERVSKIRAKVQELGAGCVFSEPQFEPKLIETVIEGTNAKAGIIDPLGAELKDGPELYFELIRGMATSVKTCLAEGS